MGLIIRTENKTKQLLVWLNPDIGNPSLYSLLPKQLTGRCRGFCWSFSTKWTALTRPSTSRWAKCESAMVFASVTYCLQCLLYVVVPLMQLTCNFVCHIENMFKKNICLTHLFVLLSGDHGHQQGRHPGPRPPASGTSGQKDWVSPTWPPAETPGLLHHHQQDEPLWGGGPGGLYPYYALPTTVSHDVCVC